MRDANTAARQAQDPETVLPYDPDEWDRRLAEARKRREAVLRQKGGKATNAQKGATAGQRGATVSQAPAAASHPARSGVPASNDWQRRLAAARGLVPAEDGAPGQAPDDTRPDHGTPSDRSHKPGTGTRAETFSARPLAHATPDTMPPDDAAAIARASFGNAQRRPGWGVAGLAALAGLAVGAALTIALRDRVPAGLALAPDTGQLAAAPLPDERTQMTVARVSLSRSPVAPDPNLPSGARLGGRPPAVGALPAKPPVPPAAARPASLAPPGILAATSAPHPPPDQKPGPPTQPSAPPVGSFVVVHVPPALTQDSGDALLSDSRAAGWPIVQVAFTVSRSHLRVYHERDRAAAADLGARLDLPVRDFVGTVPAPQGLVELWIAGKPGDAG
jgi:hypothetical protein